MFRNGKMIIYYNAEFPAYAMVLEKWKSKGAEHCKRFADEYKLHVAFHCAMQALAARPDTVDLEVLDTITEQERTIVAALVVMQADRIAAIHQQSGRAGGGGLVEDLADFQGGSRWK